MPRLEPASSVRGVESNLIHGLHPTHAPCAMSVARGVWQSLSRSNPGQPLNFDRMVVAVTAIIELRSQDLGCPSGDNGAVLFDVGPDRSTSALFWVSRKPDPGPPPRHLLLGCLLYFHDQLCVLPFLH